jgi:hypothetical protein
VIRRVLACACAAAGLTAAAGGFAQSLPPGTAECRARIDGARAAAGDALYLDEVCPEVAAALNDSDWAQALPGRSANALRADSLGALIDINAAYERPTAEAVRLDTLDGVLDEVESQANPPPLSLWDRAMRWLQERLGQRGDANLGWLEEWLSNLSIPERWLRVVVIALGALLVIATFAFVVNELRVAGVFGRTLRGAREDAGEDAQAEPGTPRVLGLDDVRRAPLARQPILLLALVLGKLRRKAAVPDSFTHRELVAEGAVLVGEPQRAAFATIVGAAERTTYGGWQPAERELDHVLASGEAVLRELAAAEGEPP